MDFGYFLLSLSLESVLSIQNVNNIMRKLLLAFCAFATICSAGAQWKPAGDKIKTDWAEKVDPRNVLPEYPRPGMERADWQNLNGEWEYAILPKGQAEPTSFDGNILVPFAVESSLSGVQKEVGEKNELWYKRTFTVPSSWKGKDILLNFGAVDWKADVFVNDILIGSHTGGFTPFSLNITPYLNGKSTHKLVVRVWDPSDKGYQPRGKQVANPEGIWYTPVTGIWQTVWIEKVPECYIGHLKITPLYDQSSIMIQMEEEHGIKDIDYEVTITARKMWPVKASGKTGKPCVIMIPHMRSWSPEDPFLYDLHVRMGEDSVESYFAMRKVEVKNDKEGIPRIFLNNEPYFEKGVLDQGYWPDGLYTPPCDEAMIYDIQKMKDLGFNMIRKHIKIEPQRWYYHCDRIGMLVWQDMVNGGRDYKSWYVTYMATAMEGMHIRAKDTRIHLMGRQDPAGQRQFEKEMKETVRLLYNHPSIVTWVIFNEGWGQFQTKKMTDIVRAEDPYRLTDSASGWFDQGCGDIRSIHDYFFPLHVTPEKRVTALTEFGGYSLQIPKHSMYEKKVYGYKKFKRKRELTAGYEKLIKKLIIPNISRGLSATVYTQLSDIEEEVNGIISYDRKIVKMDEKTVKKLNEKLHF